MPLILIFAIGLALVLYPIAAPDRWTLAVTRGVVGAIRSGGNRGRSTRSGGTRSTGSRSGNRPRPGSAKPRSTRPTVPTATPDRPRSGSRIGDGIRGWIRGADAAVARRRDAHAAWKEFVDFLLQGRRERRKADTEAAEENEQERQDRTRKRTESSDAVQQIADQYPQPAVPARPSGASVADTTQIPITELDTLDQLIAEIDAALTATQQTSDAWLPIQNWLNSISERYSGAGDLPTTPRMDAAESTVDEVGQEHVLLFLHQVEEKLKWFREAVAEEQARLKEIGPAKGRLENVSS